MAVKKTETAVQDTEAAKKDTMDTLEKDTEVIHLFKDSQRYKAPVEVPKAVAEVLRHSEEMDNAAMARIAEAEAAAVQQAQRV